MTRWRRVVLGTVGVLVASVAVLSVPTPEPEPPRPAGGKPFAWRQDERWQALEQRFVAARRTGCAAVEAEIGTSLDRLEEHVLAAGQEPPPPQDPLWEEIEREVFAVAPLVAACPAHLATLAGLQARLRSVVKRGSRGWDLGQDETRDRLYRLLYGSRAALEEAWLQSSPGLVPALLVGTDEPSRSPGVRLLDVQVHSGDLLLSRGNAPTSALIARGSDYPGNFSHVALAHVDELGRGRVLEAHIECGAAVTTPEKYLTDTKLRILLLRPRADLPQLVADPMLPHRAATTALHEIQARHIAYDFAMDTGDPTRLFCSEVASWAYRGQGLALWMGVSRISSPGVAAWLTAFGVRHLETQEPSDLEYDPQLVVVAEWRDPEALWQDHVDNAVVEAMLEGAEAGERLGYRPWTLPWARVAKGWSLVKNALGGVGPIPEGMSAASALRHQAFGEIHARLKAAVLQQAEGFRRREGYRPPYWELRRLARSARAEPPGLVEPL